MTTTTKISLLWKIIFNLYYIIKLGLFKLVVLFVYGKEKIIMSLYCIIYLKKKIK